MFVHLGVWSETVGAVCERMGFLCMDGCVCARVSLCPCPSLLCLCPLIHQDSLSLFLSLSLHEMPDAGVQRRRTIYKYISR